MAAISDIMASDEPVNVGVEASSFKSPFWYRITRGKDYDLVWEPPLRSRQLADALSYHFPEEPTLKGKLQRAIEHFWEVEKQGEESPLTNNPNQIAHTYDYVRASYASIPIDAPTGISHILSYALEQPASPILSPNKASSPLSASESGWLIWDLATNKTISPRGRRGPLDSK